jgi:tetratricopeptide (TPR) repeat protein
MTQLSTLALEQRKKGNNSEAIRLYREHLLAYPEDLYAKHNLSAALGDIGQFKESSKVMRGAIGEGLNKPQSWLVYARSLSGAGNTDEAESAYYSAISLEPLNGEAHKELSQLIWMTTGNYEAALKTLSEFIINHPQSVNLQVLRAELSGQMGNHTEQYQWMKKCYELSDKQVLMQYYLSRSALANGRFPEALKYGEIVFKSFPDDLKCSIHYINCLLANGSPGKALKVVENARKNFPLDQHLLALQATCWRLLGDERYIKLYDYDQLVMQLPLGVPPGWSSLNAYIDDLEKELDQEHCFKSHPFFLSVRHGSQRSSITSSDRLPMKAFSAAVIEPMKHYISKLEDVTEEIQDRNTGAAELLSAWSVKLFSNGFHTNHVHQEGWLSSACHIRVNGNSKVNEDHVEKAGWFKLGEPGPVCEPKLLPEKYIEPKRGHIVIFPSYMWHGTVPIRGEVDRLTVAADFQPA